MSGPSSLQGPPITDKRQLVEYHERGGKPPEAWRIGTEHEKFVFRRADLKRVPYEGPDGIGALLQGDDPLRLGAGARKRQRDRADERQPMFDHARTRRAVRIERRAARNRAPDLRGGARASAPGARGLRRIGARHDRARLRPDIAARRGAVDAEGPLPHHARLHAEKGPARPRHDAAHLHRAGQSRLPRAKPTWCGSSAPAWRCSRSRWRCSPIRRSSRASPPAI